MFLKADADAIYEIQASRNTVESKMSSEFEIYFKVNFEVHFK